MALQRLRDSSLIRAKGGANVPRSFYFWNGAKYAPYSDYESNTFNWTVPEGVTSICIVCVAAGTAFYAADESVLPEDAMSFVKRGGVTLCSANYAPSKSTAGSGGVKEGGGAGNVNGDDYGGSYPGTYYGDGPGGLGDYGVGLMGGLRQDEGPLFGYGIGIANNGSAGGELSWVNNISVTPGETLEVKAGQGAKINSIYSGRGGVGIHVNCGEFPDLPGVIQTPWGDT